jgi:hypothetical protein
MQNRVINESDDYYMFLSNKKICVSRVIPLGEEMMRLSFQDKKPFVKEHGARNVVVALWTTRY